MKKRALGVPTQLSLVKLRVSFLVLGAVLLGALLVLSLLVQSRLEEASRDREGMVASRVFDELEREVSTFLDEENERPTYRNLANTDPQAWAPFVVGYFKQNRFQIDHVAADGETSENHRRMLWAISEAGPAMNEDAQGAPLLRNSNSVTNEGGQESVVPEKLNAPPTRERPPGELVNQRVAPAPTLPQVQKKEASGTEIIESLNRAPARRKQQPAPVSKDSEEDQFSDYAERF